MERSASLFNRIPREVPLTSSITPLRARAWRCSSAALAERKPSSSAISARVGGAPVRAMALWIRSRICCWRAVSLGLSILAAPWEVAQALDRGRVLSRYPVAVFLNSSERIASVSRANRVVGDGRDHLRLGRQAGRRGPIPHRKVPRRPPRGGRCAARRRGGDGA